MKYDSVTKRVRNHEVYEYRKENPNLSMKEIGEIFGISRQRVSQIVKREVKNAKQTAEERIS
jgi:DNA-directed RNA polymerase specialized sigma subunit